MNLNVPSTDFVKHKDKELFTIIFPKSTSIKYKYAVSTAQASDRYQEITIETGQLAHQATYYQNKISAQKALALLELVSDWKGTRVFTGEDLIINRYEIEATTKCYVQAMQSRNWRSHCHSVEYFDVSHIIEEAFTINIDFKSMMERSKLRKNVKRYLIPCQRVRGYTGQFRRIDKGVRDRVQAVAIERACNWCPFFNPDDTKEID